MRQLKDKLIHFLSPKTSMSLLCFRSH